MPMPHQSLDRILDRAIPEPNTGCLLWAGSMSKDGRYGCCSYGDHTYRVPRLVLELSGVALKDGENALHRCDTPLCIEPSHLFAGTTADNVADKVRKGRQARGERLNHPHARMTADGVREMRARHAAGVPQLDLAGAFGVCRATVFDIVNHRTWRHL